MEEQNLEDSKKELSTFQARVGKLEAQIKAMRASIKKYSLLAKEKTLAGYGKSKSLYLIIKEKFKREELPQVKKILCYDCCGDIGYMRGSVKYKSGFFLVEEAEFVDYSPDREPIVIAYLGSAVLNADSVVMCF
jgi:hypothetical protein